MQRFQTVSSRPPRSESDVKGRRWLEPRSLISAVLSITMALTGVFVTPVPAHAVTFAEAREASKKISAGGEHSLAVGADTGVLAWGDNERQQCDVPAGLNGVVAVAAGEWFSLALKGDGTVVEWGGWSASHIPPNTTDADAIAAGDDHALVLNAGGTVTAAGYNGQKQCDVPAGLTDVIGIAAGSNHSLALKSDGTVVAWGGMIIDPETKEVKVGSWAQVPTGLEHVEAVAAGSLHSLALKADGTVVAWGRNEEGQCAVPAGLSGVIAIAAGLNHSLALKSDGTVVAWGGVIKEPKPGEEKVGAWAQVPAGLQHVVAVTTGKKHSFCMQDNGELAGWGSNHRGQTLGVTSVKPPRNSTDIPLDVEIIVSFNAPIQAGTAYGQVTLKDAAGTLVPISKSRAGNRLVIKPTAPLKSEVRYTVEIPQAAVKDGWGNVFKGTTFGYTTPDLTPPAIAWMNPPDGGRVTSFDAGISVAFDEALVAGPAFAGIALKNAENSVIPSTVAIGGSGNRILRVEPISDVEGGVYTLTIPPNALQDARDNRFKGTVASFEVASFLPIEEDAAGVVFDRFVTGRGAAYSGGGYVYGRWAGTRLQVRFSGDSVAWIGPKQPNYGKADVYIDGVKQATVDAYAPASAATLSAELFRADGLTDGPHTLEVRVTGQKNPASSATIVVFDRFEVTGAAPSGGGERTDEAKGAFTGPWIRGDSATYYAGGYRYSRYANASFKATFTGTKVAWIGPKTGGYGRARVYIDGALQGTVSQRGTMGWRERVWESKTLPYGKHTIEIRPTATKDAQSTGFNIVIDALDVTK